MKMKDEMVHRLLLDVVVRQRAAILKLLACEGVGGLNFKSDSLTSESLNKDLHSTMKMNDEMER